MNKICESTTYSIEWIYGLYTEDWR